MKPLFMLLTVLSSYFVHATNPPEEISPAAIKTFAQTFVNARHVSWTVSNDMYKATFHVADRFASAYFDETGELVVVTRNITQTELPLVLQEKINTNYAQYRVCEVLEATDQWCTHYYITVEGANQKIILESSNGTNWLRYKKIKK